MSVFEMAQKYYPRLWPIKRLDALLADGKLTPEEYASLVGPAVPSADEPES